MGEANQPPNPQPTMSQTYTDWNQVPAEIESTIRIMWNGSGTVTCDYGYDHNGDKIEIYKLANYNVRQNVQYLTTDQKLKIFDLALASGQPLDSYLDRLNFEIETVRVHDEIYHLPNFIVGTWLHCGIYGCMDRSGYVHT
jgi:hypothetical protein